MKLVIFYFESDEDWQRDRVTTAKLPVTGIVDAVQVVKNWPWRVNSWEIKI